MPKKSARATNPENTNNSETLEKPERLYTPEELATKLRVHLNSVYFWLHTGRLVGLRAYTRWRIQESELTKFLNTRK